MMFRSRAVKIGLNASNWEGPGPRKPWLPLGLVFPIWAWFLPPLLSGFVVPVSFRWLCNLNGLVGSGLLRLSVGSVPVGDGSGFLLLRSSTLFPSRVIYIIPQQNDSVLL